MIALGIDPGSRITGYGLVEPRGADLHHVASGVIRLAGPLASRLRQIHERLIELIATYSPQEVAVEEVFMARNFQSALALGEARGVALLAASISGLEVFGYSALQVKKAVAGYGRAGKDQVQAMVERLLVLPPADKQLPSDASDALAVAICHARKTCVRISKFDASAIKTERR